MNQKWQLDKLIKTVIKLYSIDQEVKEIQNMLSSNMKSKKNNQIKLSEMKATISDSFFKKSTDGINCGLNITEKKITVGKT